MKEYIEYWIRYHEKFTTALIEHLQIVGMTLVLSLILAALLTLLIYRSHRLKNMVIQILGAIYSIPSLALFALLIPVTGLGRDTAWIVLVAYNQFLLVRNFTGGLDGVDQNIVEAAAGMSMSDWQVLIKIQIPLAMPMILAGIRLAVISSIGIATIASTINAGGLGDILFDGMRTLNSYKLVGGTLLCTLVALIFNTLLKLLEKIAKVRVGG